VSGRNILQGWTSTASPFKHGIELRRSRSNNHSLSADLSRAAARLGSAQFLVVKIRESDVSALSLAVESFHSTGSKVRLCFAGDSRVLSQVDSLGLASEVVGLMADDVGAETSCSELIWDRIEAVRFEPSFVDRATRDMRISCALESMLGLARDLGLRTFGHFGTEECASVSDRYDFDYLPVPIGMVDTLKSITAPFNSARTQATVTAGR